MGQHTKQNNRIQSHLNSHTDIFPLNLTTTFSTQSFSTQPIQQNQLNTIPNKTKTSRRKIQRRKKRYSSKISKQIEHTHQIQLKHRCTNISNLYGFTANPNKSMTENFTKAIINIDINSSTYNSTNSTNQSLFNMQPKNLSVHNLCTHTQPPQGTDKLLGLGLKYCVTPSKPTQDIKYCLQKLAYKIRTKQYLTHNNHQSSDSYIPQIYIKLKGWNPPPATLTIENQITEFENKLQDAVNSNRNQNIKSTNLTPPQRQTLQLLKNNTEFIIMPTDKNLGPAIMNREDYIQLCLSHHLLTPQYIQLPKTTALNRISNTKKLLTDTFNTYKTHLKQSEVTYFTRSLKLQHRIPIFYGMPKVHKSPLTVRPVVSCINSFSSIFSNWLDFKMKELLPLISSYIKDSKQLIQEINQLTLPPNARLFTSDATSMYTNIDTNIGIQAFENLFTRYDKSIPSTFPKELFLKVLRIIMENNIFTFGDTYWIQTQGTAMGTPAAPLYSIITFGYHENTTILNTFKSNLLYYKRYIDDIFGIWIDDTTTPTNYNIDNPKNPFTRFKETLNQFGSLKWNTEPLTDSTNFLDLTITIKNQRLTTLTYQKPLNLYLYIPPMSAHPSSCFKGLVIGEIYRYWLQNTEEKDFINITTNFILRLLQRGHQITQILPILYNAAANIDNRNTKHKPIASNPDDTLFIHWRFHPLNINNNTIRQIYNNTLKGFDGFQQMRLAISRPKNLRDILSKTDLPNIPDRNVSNIIEKISSPNNGGTNN